MPIIAKAKGNSFLPAPEGTHAGVCVDVVDLGMLEVAWGGKKKQQHKIKIVWQIEETRPDNNKPFTVQKRYTLSLHEKAQLRKDLESWRGKAFTTAELTGFDIEQLVGIGCLLNVLRETKEGTTYANVAGVMRLPKNMAAPVAREYVRECDRQPEHAQDGPPDDYYQGPGITDDDVPF